MTETRGLTKRLGGRLVVDDVSFRCEPGTVPGSLGPNGADKTTMRLLFGLTDADAGSATMLGVPYRSMPNPCRRVGILLDASAQHDGRRGLVGLDASAATRRVGQYSLGTRQRLKPADALGDPAVLVLDEPASGLDPEGMVEQLFSDLTAGTPAAPTDLPAPVEALR